MADANKANRVREMFDSVREKPESFGEYLDCYADQVGDLVNSFIVRSDHPGINEYLYDPWIRYSRNGGKRHRPLIAFASCQAVGGDVDRALSAAAAIEHFHSAALVHDDIADEGELRRGEPCLHHSLGLGLAINVGDLGLSCMVEETVLEDGLLDDATKVRILKELSRMTRATIEGQALDIGWARDERYDIGVEDYLTMATRKTAQYSAAVPLVVGAIAGGAGDGEVEALRSFGLAAGLAFQIQDDLLNLLGEKGAKKKDFRSDITEGKRTLVVVHALQHSSRRDRLVEILSSKEKDAAVLQEAVDIMTDSGSIDFALEYARGIVDRAKEGLVASIAPSQFRDLLLSMADWSVSRLI